MSFDFGNSKDNSDPTSDFVSKFPDLDAGDADAALQQASSAPAPATGATPGGMNFGDDDDDDLLGGGAGSAIAVPGGMQAVDGQEDQAGRPKDEREQFESQFPELDDPDLRADAAPVEPQQTAYNGYMAPPAAASADRGSTPSYQQQQQQQPSSMLKDPYAHDGSDEDEPEPIREWRHAQAERIATRSATAERQKGEAISKAERDIDDFYAEYNAKKEKNIKKNKEDEAVFTEQRQRQLAEGTTWERISKLIDLQNSQSKTIAPTAPGSTDLSRYREILLSLRREGDTAPAAGGY